MNLSQGQSQGQVNVTVKVKVKVTGPSEGRQQDLWVLDGQGQPQGGEFVYDNNGI